jgi:uncharacterized protein YjbJ (UPF0337 family)
MLSATRSPERGAVCPLLSGPAACSPHGRRLPENGCAKETAMRKSTKDQVEGRIHELKGSLKQTAGQIANNPRLATQGRVEKLGGKVQKKLGQLEKVLEK